MIYPDPHRQWTDPRGRADPGPDPGPRASDCKTFESIKGAREAVVHLYNSTSTLQRKAVFKMSRNEIIELAVDGARLIKEEAEIPGDPFSL